MGIFPYIHYMAFLFYIAMSFYVLSGSKFNRLNVTIGLLFICLAIWSFDRVFQHNPALSRETIESIHIFVMPAIILISFLVILTALRLSGYDKIADNKWFLIVNMSIIGLLIYESFAGNLYVIIQHDYGWSSVSRDNIWGKINLFIDNFYVLSSVSLIVFSYFNQKNKVKRKQIRIVLLSASISVLLAHFTNVLGLFGIIGNSPNLFGMIFAAGIVIAIKKYEFVELSSSYVADTIFNTSEEFMLLITTDGQVAESNIAFEMRFGQASSIDFNTLIIDQNDSQDLFDFDSYTGKTKSLYTDMKDITGEILHVKINSRIIDSAGDALGITCVISDITEKKKYEESIENNKRHLENMVEERTFDLISSNLSLKSSNKDLQEFAHISAHDLNELNRGVLLGLQGFKKRIISKLAQDDIKFLDESIMSATYMHEVIHRLREFLDIHNSTVLLAETDLTSCIKEAAENMSKPISHSSARISYSGLHKVIGNSELLIKLFSELIDNSIKFSKRDDLFISIGTEEKYDMILVSFIDNGAGFNNTYSERIFRLLERLDARGIYKGSGMGLPICSKIINKHKGKIWAESEPGKGTKISFTLQKVEKNL